MGIHTFASEDDGKVPQLSHVEGLKDLTLVGSTITVEGEGNSLLARVLLGESNTSTDGDLGTDDTVTTVETGSEHVHRSTLSVGNTLTPAEKLTNDGLDSCAAHHSETVAAVGSDDVVLAVNGMLDTDSDGLLSGRQMAETADLLLLVESVGGHLHAAHGNHVVVHLLELALGGVQGVCGGIELVCLEALVGELDLEGLIILLLRVSIGVFIFPTPPALELNDRWNEHRKNRIHFNNGEDRHTLGTASLSACDEAASVVTVLKAGRIAGTALRLSGEATLLLIARENIVRYTKDDEVRYEGCAVKLVDARRERERRGQREQFGG